MTISAQVREMIAQGRTDQEILRAIASRTTSLNIWQRYLPFFRQFGRFPSGSFFREHRDLFPGREADNHPNSGYLRTNPVVPTIATPARRPEPETATAELTTKRPRNRVRRSISENAFVFDNTRTFGVEIECFTKLGHAALARKIESLTGLSVEAEGYNHNDHRSHWKIVSDGSLNRGSLGGDYQSAEVVSPILKGASGLTELEKVCNALTEIGAKVNSSTGLHIHHDCKESGRVNVKLAIGAVAIYRKYKRNFNAMLPSSRRNNYFCKHNTPNEISRMKHAWTSGNEYDLRNAVGCRYRSVNVHSLWRHGTLEFRQHSGSTDAAKIINWVKITQTVMTRAKQFASQDVNVWEHEWRQFHKELALGGELMEYIGARTEHFAQAA